MSTTNPITPFAAKLLEDKGVANPVRPRPTLQGWEPSVKVAGDTINFSSGPVEELPADNEATLAILRRLLPPEFDIDKYELIDNKSEFRTYDQLLGEGEVRQTYYIKGQVKIKAQYIGGLDVAALAATLRKRTIKLVETDTLEPRAGVLHWTDLQTGQADGDAVLGLLQRASEIPALFKQFVQRNRKAGTPITEIFIPVTGDLVEGVEGFYSMQAFSVELDRRQQVRIATELLLTLVTEVAQLGLPVHIAAVPGNHGEFRSGGKAFTTIGDNDDLAVVENVQRTIEYSGRFPNVRFTLPKATQYSLVTEVLGHRVSLTHGHLGGGAGNPEIKMITWVKNQMMAKNPVGDFDILFSGHYHHSRTIQMNGNRWWVMGGALCDISDYFDANYGLASAPAISFHTITEAQTLESTSTHVFSTPETARRGIQ